MTPTVLASLPSAVRSYFILVSDMNHRNGQICRIYIYSYLHSCELSKEHNWKVGFKELARVALHGRSFRQSEIWIKVLEVWRFGPFQVWRMEGSKVEDGWSSKKSGTWIVHGQPCRPNYLGTWLEKSSGKLFPFLKIGFWDFSHQQFDKIEILQLYWASSTKTSGEIHMHITLVCWTLLKITFSTGSSQV